MQDFLNDITSGITVSKNSQVYLLLDDGRFLTNPNSSKIMKDNYFNEATLRDLKKAGLNETSFFGRSEKVIIQNGKYYASCRIGLSSENLKTIAEKLS